MLASSARKCDALLEAFLARSAAAVMGLETAAHTPTDARQVLLVNAGAVLSFKLPKGQQDLDGAMSFKERLFVLISSLRVFRIMIGLWNVFVLFLMIVWFP